MSTLLEQPAAIAAVCPCLHLVADEQEREDAAQRILALLNDTAGSCCWASLTLGAAKSILATHFKGAVMFYPYNSFNRLHSQLERHAKSLAKEAKRGAAQPMTCSESEIVPPGTKGLVPYGQLTKASMTPKGCRKPKDDEAGQGDLHRPLRVYLPKGRKGTTRMQGNEFARRLEHEHKILAERKGVEVSAGNRADMRQRLAGGAMLDHLQSRYGVMFDRMPDGRVLVRDEQTGIEYSFRLKEVRAEQVLTD